MTMADVGAGPLRFAYTDAKGRQTKRSLARWRDNGTHVAGVSIAGGGVRTFSKERMELLTDDAAWEACQYSDFSLIPESANLARVRRAPDNRLQIAFTGFAAARRAEWESLADETGLRVCKGVTAGLSFICAGPNAGPKKLEKAREQGVIVLTEAEFLNLMENGELPD